MFHITEQLRDWSMKNICQLAGTFLEGRGYLEQYPMSRVKGKTSSCNVLDIMRTIFEADKKFMIGEHPYTGKGLLEKVEMYILRNQKAFTKCPIISDGRHRAIAVTIAMALGGEGFDVAATFVDVDEKSVRSNSFETNVAHDMATPLGKMDKLKEVIGLIEGGEATKEADIQKLNLTRYQAQEFWAKAELVRHQGFSIEEATKLPKEDARNAAKSADARAYLADKAKGKKGPTKVLSGPKIREAWKLINEAKLDHQNTLYRVLNALCAADEIAFKDLVREIINVNK